MSSRRSKGSSAGEDEIKALILRLRAEISQSGTNRVSLSKVLGEASKHIKRLNREVDDLSERISELIASPETSSAEADILRRLLQR